MTYVHGKFSKSCRVASCLTLALVAVGCSGADLGASTGQGTTPLDTTATGGASSASNTGTGSGQTGGTPSTSTKTNSGGSATTTSTGGGSSASAPSWSKLYSSYFGSGTSGNCTSCHGAGTQPTFSSASTMCSALKQVGYIQSGTATLQNLLTWFGKSGTMPLGGGTAPANAVADINAWQSAGAVCP